jgi:RND family efflux transporter MFP subunit
MNRIPLRRSRWAVPIIALTAALLAGCRQVAEKQKSEPPIVTVNLPVEREVIRWDEYSGYLSSPKMVTVNARVSGLIEQAHFREGAIVHAGDLLFKIDPRPFQADLDNKKAAVAQAKALEERTKADFARSTALLRAQVVARADYDSTRAAYEEAEASLSSAEAALETSRLNLEWTEVRAPITGRISRMDMTVGNLVNGGVGQATPLTTIVSIDPLYCYISVPESAAMHYRELSQERSDSAGTTVPCFLRLENEATFARPGVIDFVDNQVDMNTGTVQIRCVVANPTTLLMPGLFAVMRVPASGRYQALLIPDAAVNTDQNERYLLVVGTNDIVQRRPVKLGALFGTLRSITAGLNPGQWVVVNGTQWAIPGAKVEPHEEPIAEESLRALESVQTGAAATETTLDVSTTSQSDSPSAGQSRP